MIKLPSNLSPSLSDEEARYILSLGDHPGWRLYLAEIERQRETEIHALVYTDPDDLRHAQGRISGLGAAAQTFRALVDLAGHRKPETLCPRS